MTSQRDRRVTMALKWHYLDNLSPREVRDRFEAEGIGDYSVSTIRDYLNEDAADEVIEQIEKENANVRLQAAERFERLYQQAKDDHDHLAVDDDPVMAVVPRTERLPHDAEPMTYPSWELVDPADDDWPDWATPGLDTVVRFTTPRRKVQPGEMYPVKGLDGAPKYTSEFAGLERDAPDHQGRQSARREMAGHMREKADVLGVYQTNINLKGEIEHSAEVELDAETAAAIREATLSDE